MNFEDRFDGIGGYFQLDSRMNPEPIKYGGSLVNSGRNALELILRASAGRGRGVSKVYIPDFYCGSIKNKLIEIGMPFEEYPVNMSLEVEKFPVLEDGAVILLVNYFGVKGNYISDICRRIEPVIVDNCQAWFDNRGSCVSAAFYSPRKFFGVPDGGIAIAPFLYKGNGAYRLIMEETPRDESYDRCKALLKRIDWGAEVAFEDSVRERMEVGALPLKRMSRLTESILRNLPFSEIKSRRIENFQYLHKSFYGKNPLSHIFSSNPEGPMVYPFYCEDPELRHYLHSKRIYTATYWPELISENGGLPSNLASNIIPLPIDQRYDRADMDYIAKTVEDFFERG